MATSSIVVDITECNYTFMRVARVQCKSTFLSLESIFAKIADCIDIECQHTGQYLLTEWSQD